MIKHTTYISLSLAYFAANCDDPHYLTNRCDMKSVNILASKQASKQAEVRQAGNDGSTSVKADDTTKSDIITTLEKVEDDHRWLMSVQ